MLVIHHAALGPGPGIPREDEQERRMLVQMSYPGKREGSGPKITLLQTCSLKGSILDKEDRSVSEKWKRSESGTFLPCLLSLISNMP